MINRLLIVICFLVSLVTASQAQPTGSAQRYKIALFVPLFLDSAFNSSGDYNYGKQFPKFFNPGLEFYEGAQLALDSLENEGIKLEVTVYDTRGSKSIAQLVAEPGFNNTQLIIAHVSTYNEVSTFSRIAQDKAIPFINANLPNDGNVTKNPYLVVLNSTLKAHCQGIYRFLQKTYPTARLVVFQKNGAQENILKSYFTDIAKSTATIPLKLKFVTLDNNFTAKQVASYLDSTEQTICLGASLNEDFAKTLSQYLASLNKLYPSQLIGMPTWDVIPFEKKEYAGLEIFYSTPFYNAKTDSESKKINAYFSNELYSRPSDMVFRGYECMFRFGKLLAEHGPNLSTAIGERKYKVFTDFDIQPVFLNSPTQGIDYFENKKLYFVKKLNGDVKGVY